MPTNARAASRMRSTSSGSFTHQTYALANAVRALRDLVEVAARHGMVARVKPVRHLRCGEDVDVRRQLVVQPLVAAAQAAGSC